MTSQAKLTVRPLPHLDFVLGYPGIPASSQASRNAAHIAGSIEVRLGSKGLKARWLRVELRKLESAAGGENWGELIGKGPIDVWTARAGTGKGDRESDADGGQWEVLKTADFPFRILIPEGLPPSCRLDKQCGISYEVVASLCVKTPKGLFRKEESTSVIQSMHPITMEKHELHSTWPLYNQSDIHSGESGLLRAKLYRTSSCYAPGDRVKVKIIVYSNRVEPAKLKSVAFSIKETVTFHGVKTGRLNLTSNAANDNKPASQHVETITQKAKSVGKKLYKGDSLNFDLECIIPKAHGLMTISTAKHIEVSYTMRVYVDISKAPIVIDHIPMFMTTFPRVESTSLIRKIGFVEGLSERDLVIEDDDDDAPSQVMSRTASQRPSASRSGSYGGSSTGVGYNNMEGVRRRDTVMTNFSGPGMAGRGVPGQLFSYGSYGGVESYLLDGVEPPRPAFAGPSSVYEGPDSTLSPTERAALAHYHTNTPNAARVLGVDYSAFANASGLDTPPMPPRSQFMAIPEEGQSEAQRIAQMSRQSVLMGDSTAARENQLRKAEEEKERLYQRAREQAERNQRRADEQRAKAQGQRASFGAPLSPPISDTRSSTPARPSSGAATTKAEEEKQLLYERARREAETYQRGYTHGATFPKEEEAQASGTVGSPQPERRPERRRDSDLFWLDSAKNTTVGPASSSLPPSSLSKPVFPSAEEEKKRLYEQAKAQTESHLQSQQGQASGAASGSSAMASGPGNGAAMPSAATEKAQLARFQAAIDAVERHQMRASNSDNATLERQRPQSAMAPPPPFPASSSTPTSTLTEKEQMKLYYAAKDRQAEAETGTSTFQSLAANPQRHSMGSAQAMASPRPTYANNYQNGNLASWEQGRQSSPHPQGSGNGLPPSSSLPMLSQLRLGNDANGSNNTNQSSWLPKIATSSSWIEDDLAASMPSTSLTAPPLPPKTPIVNSPR